MEKTVRLSEIAAFLLLSVKIGLPAGVRLVHHPRQTSSGFHGHPRLVVEDPDAHRGTAQAAVPGKSHPDSAICSFYSYARPAGRYRVTWRAKIDDNTIAEVVFRAATARGSISAKGTDFAKPNVYQEFSYTAEKGEGGFFGVSASWKGLGTVHIDRVTVVSEKLFTERELLAKRGGLPLPDEWFLPPPSPLRLHLAKGLWWDYFGLSEAMAELGGGIVTASYHGKGQWGTSLRGFPHSWQKLMEHNLVVLANVDAPALRARGRLLLDEYVRNGGALLVLGGPFAFERGGYQHTALAGLLPCRILGPKRLSAEGGFVMKPTEGAEKVLPPDLSWQMRPRVYYYHPLEAKPDAQVLAAAGGKPLVIVWGVGKGRVAAVAATAEGDPPLDQLAFWEWGDMPRLVAAVCRWLVASQEGRRPQTIDGRTRKTLEQLVVSSPTKKEMQQWQQLLTGLLPKCRSADFARELLTAISNFEGTLDRRSAQAVVRAARPHVNAGFGDLAEELIDSGDVGKAEVGLQILGLCRSEGAGERLVRFIQEGEEALSGGSIDDLLDGERPDSSASEPGLGVGERLKLAATLALGDLGDRRHVGILRKTTAQFAERRQQLSEVIEVADLNENVYQQSLAARCRLGDAQAVGPLLDAILRNEDEIEQFQNARDNMLPNKDDKNLMHILKVAKIRLPVLHRRQAFCAEMLSRLPYSVAGPLAKELSRRDDPRLTSFAFAALTPTPRRQLTRETAAALAPLLRKCRLAELRLLAFRLASRVGGAAIDAQISSDLAALASDSDSAPARFVLRMASRLEHKMRPPIVAAGLRHADQRIRRLARLSLPLLPVEQRKALQATR